VACCIIVLAIVLPVLETAAAAVADEKMLPAAPPVVIKDAVDPKSIAPCLNDLPVPESNITGWSGTLIDTEW